MALVCVQLLAHCPLRCCGGVRRSAQLADCLACALASAYCSPLVWSGFPFAVGRGMFESILVVCVACSWACVALTSGLLCSLKAPSELAALPLFPLLSCFRPSVALEWVSWLSRLLRCQGPRQRLVRFPNPCCFDPVRAATRKKERGQQLAREADFAICMQVGGEQTRKR